MQFLTDFIGRFSGAVGFIGSCMIAFGVIQLALMSKDVLTGGGAQIAGAIGMIVAGVLVVAAAAYFGMIDTSWAN